MRCYYCNSSVHYCNVHVVIDQVDTDFLSARVVRTLGYVRVSATWEVEVPAASQAMDYRLAT